jgi:NADH-quinone oxidoreductase subunit G
MPVEMSMSVLIIDGRRYPARPDGNLLELCLAHGLDLPYFCWHPALGSVGACRQCAVKQFQDADDDKGKLVMACMTPAKAGTRISIHDGEAREFRSSVVEWLMTNHPHDCPVCDEGGECHLQDMTVMTGHAYRRYRGTKRTFRNQDLGPCINHEMNRCITCYRCVRFYRDYAGGTDLHALASKNHVYFGRAVDGTLESAFSGNLVEVCPTGVFTDRTLKRHYTRKWDLQSAPSICVHCAVGCNTLVGERYGSLRRVLNRYNADVNGHFICDRGRFGYEFVNAPQRLEACTWRAPGETAPRVIGRHLALARVGELCRDRASVLAVGSPRASLESNYALRELVGADRFALGVSDREAGLLDEIVRLQNGLPVATPTLREVEACDAVFVLGEDVAATAPRLGLALRQSVRNAAVDAAAAVDVQSWDDAGVRTAAQDVRSPLFLATPFATGLDDVATRTYHAAPDDLAQLGFAVAHELDSGMPDAPGIGEDMRALARTVVSGLRAAERPLIVSGTGCGSAPILRAAANVTLALHRAGKPVRARFVAPECNSLGLAILGGRRLADALAEARSGRLRTLVVLENDLYRRMPRAEANELLASVFVIAIDHTRHETTECANACLPAATFAESSGTLVNSEGRAQRFLRAALPHGDAQDSWRWPDLLRQPHADDAAGRTLDELTRACAESAPALARIVEAAPESAARWAGQKIPRQPAPYSGRTAMHAALSVHEPKPPADPDAPLAFSMEGYPYTPPTSVVTHYWAPGWNSAQASHVASVTNPGALAGAAAGIRLRGSADPVAPFPPDSGTSPRPSPEALHLVPRYAVFGSEELSMRAPAIAARASVPTVALNSAEGAARGLAAGDEVEVRVASGTCHVVVSLDVSVPRGSAAILVGRPGMAWLDLPAWGTVQRKVRT